MTSVLDRAVPYLPDILAFTLLCICGVFVASVLWPTLSLPLEVCTSAKPLELVPTLMLPMPLL